MDDFKKTKVQLVEEIKGLREAISLQRDRFRAAMLQSSIIASAMDAILIIDETQNIVEFNASAEQVFGYKMADVIGKPIHMLLPDRFRDSHRRHIQHFCKTAFTSRAMHALEIMNGLHANGMLFPIEASISQTIVDNQKFYAVIFRDVSEREN